MKDKVKNLVRVCAFIVVLGMTLLWVQDVVTPSRDWPTKDRRVKKMVTSIFNEPRDSMDVLWLGTSQVFSGIAPMEIYRASGLRSYDLSVVGERVPVGYYLLKSVMAYQSPKVVALDASSIFYSEEQNKVKASWQGTIDSYPFTRIKDRFAMTAELAKLNGSSIWDENYLKRAIFPLLHYHTNYQVEKEEFTNLHLGQVFERKGYVPNDGVVAAKDGLEATVQNQLVDDDEDDDISESYADMVEDIRINRKYLDQIKALCDSKGCEFILLKIPVLAAENNRGHWSWDRHSLLQELADDMGVPFLDMNYEDVGMDWLTDSADGGKHLNLFGATKVSTFLADWLARNYTFEPADEKVKSQWDYELELYDWQMGFSKRRMVLNLSDYMDRLAEENCTILTVVSGGVGDYWTDELQEKFMALTGCFYDLRDAEGAAYVAQSANGEILYENRNAEQAKASGTLGNGQKFVLTSKSGNDDKTSSIKVEGVELSSQSCGIRFVVYDNDLNSIVDSVSFNTFEPDCTCVRTNTAYKLFYNEAVMDYVYKALKKM